MKGTVLRLYRLGEHRSAPRKLQGQGEGGHRQAVRIRNSALQPAASFNEKVDFRLVALYQAQLGHALTTSKGVGVDPERILFGIKATVFRPQHPVCSVLHRLPMNTSILDLTAAPVQDPNRKELVAFEREPGQRFPVAAESADFPFGNRKL